MVRLFVLELMAFQIRWEFSYKTTDITTKHFLFHCVWFLKRFPRGMSFIHCTDLLADNCQRTHEHYINIVLIRPARVPTWYPLGLDRPHP